MKRRCPVCNGNGCLDDGNYAYMAYHNRMKECPLCNGNGKVSMRAYMEYVRAHRRAEN